MVRHTPYPNGEEITAIAKQIAARKHAEQNAKSDVERKALEQMIDIMITQQHPLRDPATQTTYRLHTVNWESRGCTLILFDDNTNNPRLHYFPLDKVLTWLDITHQ